MTAIELGLAGLVMAAGATVQGSIGFGLNVVAAPLLVLIDTRLVPGPALVAAFVLATLLGLRDHAGIDRRGLEWILAGRVPGTVFGAYAVAALSSDGLAIALSISVLVAVGLSAVGWRLPRTVPALAGTGAVSGVMGTVSSIGGPPVAMLYQDARGSQLRGTLSVIFSVGALMSVGFLAVAGRFGADELRVSMVLVPGVVAGFVASRWTSRWLDRSRVRPAVLGLCAASAIAALVRYAL